MALAERGLSVTLVDTSADLLALAEARAESMPALARILHGDATRLSNHPDLAGEHGTFDAVLLLSPLMSISSSDLCAAALRDAWDFVCPHGGVLFCAWASRLAYYRRLALADPVQLARDQDEDYASRSGGKAWHVRHYEVPENMPGILREATGMEDVEMVGAEGVLAGGLDRMVNELEGQELEVRAIALGSLALRLIENSGWMQAWVQKCLEIGADEHGWRMADHIVGIAMKLVDSTGR